ncbi:hypothetical protein [Paenochrobactrum pullorum]|uniref:hypothetical protein n=1 Tax=Paenochrobactrum pullorum TaxID=1324351 RepID=UPI0035BBD1DB
MAHIIKTEVEHIKVKIDEIKAKIEDHIHKSEHEKEIEAIRFELDDLVNRINSILPH